MNVVLATTTYYQNPHDLRYLLAKETVRLAGEAGLPIMVVDGAPGLSFSTELRQQGAEVYPQTLAGMGSARRLAFFYALNYLLCRRKLPDGIVIWLEPEKTDLIRFVPRIIKPIIDNKADVVIPSRSPKSWASYPVFQQTSEQDANRVYEQVTQRRGFDPMFGPVAFRATFLLTHFVHPFSPDTYIQHFIPMLVPNNRVASVETDFIYPPEQKKSEDNDEKMTRKREEQNRVLKKAYLMLAPTS